MSARKVTVVRYLFALSDHKVWAYIVREDPTVFDLKRLDGVECQDPSQAPGQMEGYLQQWKNAMSLNSQEFPQGHTYQGKSGQLPSLEGRSVCLLSDSSDPALVIEMTGILDELWQASAASRNQYEDIPWKQEDFQTFLDLQEQPFGPGLRLKDVKNDALVTVTSLNAKGWLGLKIYGSLDKGLTPALRQSSSAAKVMVPRQPSSVAKAIAPPPESPSTAPQRPEKQPSAESKPESKPELKPEKKAGRAPALPLKAHAAWAAGLRATPRSGAASADVARTLSAVRPGDAEDTQAENSPNRAPDMTVEQAQFILGKMSEGYVDTVSDPR